jgi:hypothetical protein
LAPKPLRIGQSPRHTARLDEQTGVGTLPVLTNVSNTGNINNRSFRLGRPTRRPIRRAARPRGGAMSELDLHQEELRELAGRVIDAAGSPAEPFGLYTFLPQDPEAALARWVEQTVFDEFFGNSAALLDEEYGRYEPASFFMCVLDHRRRLPAGAARVTMASDRGLKTLDDIQRVWGLRLDEVLARSGREWDLDRVWDAVTMAIAPDYRGKSTDGLLSLAMNGLGLRTLRACGGQDYVCVLDLEVLALFNSVMHDAFVPFPGVDPIRYLDSPLSVPAFTDLDDLDRRLRAADPIMHGIMFEGVGLEAAVREMPWVAVLQRAGRDPQPGLLRR